MYDTGQHQFPGRSSADMKARQIAKIREIGEALGRAGFHGLDAQTKALGLARSTTWTVLQSRHKNSGLSAPVINQMLASQLPVPVRLTILEYIEEKSAGIYGHNRAQLRRFVARVSLASFERMRKKIAAHKARQSVRTPLLPSPHGLSTASKGN